MLTIGKLARQSGISTDAVRYYEREGLLTPAQKTAAGYRLYNQDAVRRLHFIKHAQQCGFSLAEVRELLELRNRGRSCCTADVRSVAIAKKRQLESRIEALLTLTRALSHLIDTCTDDTKPLDACPILRALETTLDETDKRRLPLPRSRRLSRTPSTASPEA